MKQTISEEEYNNALNVYKNVQEEKENLQNMSYSKVYNAHLNLPGTFGELKINLLRKNKEIDLEIDKLKKTFLQQKAFSPEAYKILEEAITIIEQKLQTNVSIKDTSLSPILLEIAELISRKNAHTTLYNYIINLETEEQNALKIINAYQKQNKKSSFFRR